MNRARLGALVVRIVFHAIDLDFYQLVQLRANQLDETPQLVAISLSVVGLFQFNESIEFQCPYICYSLRSGGVVPGGHLCANCPSSRDSIPFVAFAHLQVATRLISPVAASARTESGR